jgi:shikimate kinase
MELGRSIFLIGLMGAGKTTIGQMLAKRIGFKFVDSDHVLERRTGATAATIFEVEGEESFRNREAAVIDEISMQYGIVLATGGGAVTDSATRERLKQRGTVVYLHATAAMAYERVRKNRDRPLLMVDDPLDKLKTLYEARHPLYLECAHHVVESHRDRPSLVVQDVIALVTIAPR